MVPPSIIKLEYQQNAKYVVAQEISGGMGTVYKLFPIGQRFPVVAMKTIRGDSSIHAFDEECEAWFSVGDHPNIARPIAFGSWNSLPSVVIEWYPQTLGELSPEDLSINQIKRLISGTVAALKFAYDEKKIIHQDVKPANILIDRSGEARLSDFGIARCLKPDLEDGRRDAFPPGALTGTPFYMAPELWGGDKPSVRTDVFSLGVTFYQWLVGSHPYASHGSRPARDAEFNPLPLVSKNKQSGIQEIGAFLRRCLAVDPRQRFQHYDDMLSAFDWLRRTEGPSRWTTERSEIVASTAQFLLAKGERRKAFQFLKNLMDDRPHDLVLINALARLHASEGEHQESDLNFSLCYEQLRYSSGVYEGRFLPRPALAWARSKIRIGRFDEAASIISGVLAWADEAKLTPRQRLVGNGLYAEVGWYLLYKGKFAEATQELLTHAAHYSLGKLESVWAVEAAWLSGLIRMHADEIAAMVLENPLDVLVSPGERALCWSRFILREYTNKILSSEIWKTTPSYVFVESSNLEAAQKLPAGSLLMPAGLALQKTLLEQIDEYSTGGSHIGHIRSISKI